MKASYRWLRALVPGLTASPAEIAERLVRAGLEVEGVSPFGAGLDTVVVAAVRKTEPHPSRSGLTLVTVDRGGGIEQRVVCGAPNVPAPGGLVVLAPLGTHLPAAGMTIAPREIAGVKSEGMLCSEVELGLAPSTADAHGEGILVLPPKTAEPGTPLTRAVPASSDTILEISVTPNRPDALGHVGLARELAALYELPFAAPPPESPARAAEGKIDTLVRVEVADFERCPHYGAAAVIDVKIGPSPAWLRYRLLSLGVRPISNVVDVTNLVLLEFGQPMHAFDLDKVRGGVIRVRTARPGEKLLTLDGVMRELSADDLMICDGEGPLALAGVMGGGTSEISRDTRRVLLECAYFSPRGIRRAARRHGLHTESSHRFERGIDRGNVPEVLAHAASLLTQLAAGAAVPGAIHVFEKGTEKVLVTLRSARLDALLGTRVPFGEAAKILERLGFDREPAPGNDSAAARFSVPTFRPDVAREADLIEEVARVRGLDAIPSVLPAIRPQAPRTTGLVEGRLRAAAAALGLSEAITYGFVSPRDLEIVGAPPPVVRLANPMTAERSVMRTSLLPGLLEALSRALRHGETGGQWFTLGARFLPPREAGPLAEERASFAALLAGTRENYLAKPEEFDVFDAKGLATELVERTTGALARVSAQSAEERASHLHPRAAANVYAGAERVGQFGLLHPDVLTALDIDMRAVVVVELDVDAIARAGKMTAAFKPIARLPAATRDIALVVHDDVAAGEVERVIAEAAGDLCESVRLFDLFRGPSLPKDHRSLAFHVIYRDPRAITAPSEARTLTDQEVDLRHAAVVSAAQKRFGATLRA